MRHILILVVLAGLIFQPVYADWNPFKKDKKEKEKDKVAEALAQFRKADPEIKHFFDEAFGYAIFPTVGKGGMGIGGAYGKGEVYQNGKLIGTTSLKQLTIGFQLGGQTYSEIIFFKDKETLEKFTEGEFELSAQASAVAVKKGVSSNTVYDNGMAIFTLTKGGLMYEATVAGQKFSFKDHGEDLEEKKEKKK